MINWYSKYLILLIIILALPACKKQKRGQFKALSYNVAGLPAGFSSSEPDIYTAHISPLLNDYAIVHVQEDFCYHDSLLLYATHPYLTDPMPCVPDGDGLNTFSEYPISNVIRTAWADCSGFDCLTPKGFYFSQIAVSDQVTIDFYNVHCNAGGDDESKAARRGNLKQLLDSMAVYSTDNPIIIMGDFNSRYTREGDTIRVFSDMGFKDAWIELVRDGDFPTLGTDKLKDCDLNPSGASCESVDKIFYKSSETIEIIATTYQRDDERFYYNENDTLPLSDHAPLYVLFEYKPK